MSAPMTPDRLAEILARAEAATPGPWCNDAWEIYQGEEYVPGVSAWLGETCRAVGYSEQDRANAAFVAAARTDLPDLVAELERLRKDRDAFREQRNTVFKTNEELLIRVERAELERLQVQNENRTLTRRVAELEAELRIGTPWKCDACGKGNTRDVCVISEADRPEATEETRAKAAVARSVAAHFPLVTAFLAEDPCRPCGCPKRFDRHADGCPTLECPNCAAPADATGYRIPEHRTGCPQGGAS